MRKRSLFVAVIIAIALLGADMLFCGVRDALEKSRAEKEYSFAEAHYSHFESYSGGVRWYGSYTHFRLIYEYEVDGETYYASLHANGELPEEDSFIFVYYNPADPQKNFAPVADNSSSYIQMGIIFLLIAGCLYFFTFMKGAVKRRLDSVYRNFEDKFDSDR